MTSLLIGPNVRQDIIEALRNDGDTYMLPVSGMTLRLRFTQDEDCDPFTEYDCYGRIKYIDQRVSWTSRPAGFTGNAEKLHTGRDAYWWEPPADFKRTDSTFPAYRQLVLELLEFGMYVATLERCEDVDAYGRLIVRDVASIGGWEPMPNKASMAEIVGQLIDHLGDRE